MTRRKLHRRLRRLLLLAALAGCGDAGGGGPVDGPGSGGVLGGGGTGAIDGVGGAPGTGGGGSGGALLDGGTDPSPDASMSDAAVPDDGGMPDAGGVTCDDPMRVPRDGRCVPRCQPLPASYETVAMPPTAPPFGNTVWFDPDIITADDPSAFVDLAYTGTGTRNMYDRRSASFVTLQAHLFDARFGSDVILEVQVNPEFTQPVAEAEATRYATVIGRLPAFLFADLQTVWIHRGMEPFGGGNNNLLIHTDQGDAYAADGVLEETLVHEATHTSIDSHHAAAADWLAAQQADGVAISPYATQFPDREDLAETMAPYLAATLQPDRLDPGVAVALRAALPNRFKYLDCLELSMAPPE